MPNFTYLPDPEDPETVSTHGFSFTAGEWTPVPDDHVAVAKLRGNRFFKEQEGAASEPIGLADSEQPSAENGAEPHDSGSADAATSTNVSILTRAGDVSEQVPSRGGPAIEITALQCRAARAGLEWSREHLAELAKVGERTITDFERLASNMLRSKRTAIRIAFEAAGVIFQPGNGIWFTEASPIAANSEKNSDTPSAENSGETALENEDGEAIEEGGNRIAA
jgi:hypothetical protein